MKKRPLILVSNDDGITSQGIQVLVDIMVEYGDVVVVAPGSPQSGMGHAITVAKPIMLRPSTVFGDKVKAFECSGTPADCVKIGRFYALVKVKPDLVVSGINHGSNTSISVIYSGTMSAAIEGAVEKVPSIGFSLCDNRDKTRFDHFVPYIHEIVKNVIEKGLPEGIALNVNCPQYSGEKIKGMKICRQTNARWIEDFVERENPMGSPYFWMTGEFKNFDVGDDYDEWAIEHNYVSVVPCQYDLTAHQALKTLTSSWGL